MGSWVESIIEFVAIAGDSAPWVRFAVLFVLSLVGPATLIPIMLVAYLCGLLFQGVAGTAIALALYGVSAFVYCELGSLIDKRAWLVRLRDKVKDRLNLFLHGVSLFTIALLAMVVPFLPLALWLGVSRQARWKAIMGLTLGGLPSLLLSVEAGHAGRSFILEKDTTYIVLSVAGLLLALVLGVTMKSIARRKLNV